ncbi:MAG: pyridoxamine 5'-phosphate oxidase family protein [Halobacteriota archaeon]
MGKAFYSKTKLIDIMDFEKCVKFANEHTVCAVATVEGDQPQNRMFGMWFADTSGFYFSTNKAKAVFRQLSDNPKIALSFYAPPERPLGQTSTMDLGMMMRVIGTAEFINDPAMKERLLNERPFLRPFADSAGIFRVKNGEAWFWTAADMGRESTIDRVRF